MALGQRCGQEMAFRQAQALAIASALQWGYNVTVGVRITGIMALESAIIAVCSVSISEALRVALRSISEALRVALQSLLALAPAC